MAGQYVAFMKHGKRIYSVPPKTSFNLSYQASRSFPLGSNWLYLRVFCRPESADLILLYTLLPFLIKNQKRVKKWFFIRYDEDGYHLRIRLNIAEENIGEVLSAFKNQLSAKGHKRLVKELQGDTYRRELERYGADIIELVELYFEASSNFTLKTLQERSKNQTFLTEFDAGIFTSFYLINCMLDEPERVKIFTNKLSDGFLSEFKANKELHIDIDAKYRAIRSHLKRLLEEPVETLLTRKLHAEFKSLLARMQMIVTATKHKSQPQIHILTADLIHMHLNRMFRANQRQQEFLVYYCLHKYISSKIIMMEKLIYPG